jgi:hypothetical protein
MGPFGWARPDVLNALGYIENAGRKKRTPRLQALKRRRKFTIAFDQHHAVDNCRRGNFIRAVISKR